MLMRWFVGSIAIWKKSARLRSELPVRPPVEIDHVNHTGSISTGGLTGSSDRSLADFFQIAIDPTNHLINIAYADNHAGTSVTYFTRQKKAAGGICRRITCSGH